MEAPFVNTVPLVRLDAGGRIDEDLICICCGYNTRGLLADAVCPECGTAVGRSFQGDFLRYAAPDWVETLASGMNWLLISIVVNLCFGVLAAIVSGVAASGRTAAPFGSSGELQLIGHALGIIAVIGYWKLTTPDPARVRAEGSLSARKLVRFTAVLNYALAFCIMGAPQLVVLLAQMLQLIGGLSAIVGYFAVFLYARQLAKRIPNERLAGQLIIVMWGFVVLGVLAIVGVFIGAAMSGAKGGGAGAAVALVMCPAGVAFLVFAIWALVLLIWFRRELAKAAQTARQTWARTPVTGGPPTPTW